MRFSLELVVCWFILTRRANREQLCYWAVCSKFYTKQKYIGKLKLTPATLQLYLHLNIYIMEHIYYNSDDNED